MHRIFGKFVDIFIVQIFGLWGEIMNAKHLTKIKKLLEFILTDKMCTHGVNGLGNNIFIESFHFLKSLKIRNFKGWNNFFYCIKF